MVRPIALALCAMTVLALAVEPGSRDEKSISTRMGTLRSLPDAERGKLTRELAMEIRGLTPSETKSSLASSLSNLATEADFGGDVLQVVTTTLCMSLKETPLAGANGEPNWAYTHLADLEIYEGMKVDLESPDLKKAREIVKRLEDLRSKVDFSLTDMSGKQWSLSKLKGKVVLVNFWATWCPPCRKEMPDIQALYDEYKDKGLVVLAISDETLDKVKPFIEQGKYTYPVMLDPGRKVNEAYQINGIPKNFVYDREGRLVAQSIDARSKRQFIAMLAKAGLK